MTLTVHSFWLSGLFASENDMNDLRIENVIGINLGATLTP